MAQLTIVYWRDIPAQVIVKAGRKAAKRQLPERFEQAIDRCAMKVGARDSDAYLQEWRRGEPVEVEGDLEAIASAEAERLDTAFDAAALKTLIGQDGWSTASATALKEA
ncbi:MAG: virulence factor [Pseudomonadota bacterium]